MFGLVGAASVSSGTVPLLSGEVGWGSRDFEASVILARSAPGAGVYYPRASGTYPYSCQAVDLNRILVLDFVALRLHRAIKGVSGDDFNR